jgi:hypothetical protein
MKETLDRIAALQKRLQRLHEEAEQVVREGERLLNETRLNGEPPRRARPKRPAKTKR